MRELSPVEIESVNGGVGNTGTGTGTITTSEPTFSATAPVDGGGTLNICRTGTATGD